MPATASCAEAIAGFSCIARPRLWRREAKNIGDKRLPFEQNLSLRLMMLLGAYCTPVGALIWPRW
ncbi:MAG: hypothetical protein ACI91G_000094 [Gammaproteobacteria bacterium]|jgi:hypothetical protein